jgi:molybdenum-dependent DNA-binding transcriptional regulator ModE
MPIRHVDIGGPTHYRWGSMETRREETGPVTDSMLENYRVLTQETMPAYKKRITELEARIKELEAENSRFQPKPIGNATERK